MGTGQERLSSNGTARAASNGRGARARVGYLVSRFPKITETFVLDELIQLERLGFDVRLFSLLRTRERIKHEDARRIGESVCFAPFLSPRVLAANAHYLLRRPGRYLGTLLDIVRRTWKSPNFLCGGLATFPKVAFFAREMERMGIEHVHAHFSNHPALAALVVHHLTDIPFSFTAHGSDLHVDQTALDWKLSKARFAVMISDYNRRFVSKRVGSRFDDKMPIVRCGVDPERHQVAAERPDDTFRILCVAALRNVKGHRHLIDACRILKQEGIAFRCDLVGKGPLEKRIRRAIAEGDLGAEVHMHGALPRRKVLDLMATASVVCLPSVKDAAGRREGIPVTLMEAMSCGVPVVASRLSGIPELITDRTSGLLVTPGDASDLAAALRRLNASPHLRARLGRAGRAKIEAEFDLRRNAAKLADLIAAPAAPPPSPASGPKRMASSTPRS